MRRMMTKSAVCLFVGLVFAVQVYAQRNEITDWQAIQDQRDAHRRAELLESFIKNYPTSPQRPEADFKLTDFYNENKDYQKILQHASDYQTRPPSADAAAKTRIYTVAMAAGISLQNAQKTVEFGGYALQVDPNNLSVLTTLASLNLPDGKKALEYAQKAITLPRPATMREESYNSTMGRMHGIVAGPLFAEQKYREAKEHLQLALKANPKDQSAQYRMGFADVTLMGAAVKAAQEAQDVATKALLAKPTDQAAADAAQAKMAAAAKEALELRDSAIDSLARALAIGGTMTKEVTPLFDGLYSNKAGSLDGKDQFIAQKKTELGL